MGRGNSGWPFLKTGTLISTSYQSPTLYQPGDLVAYISKNETVCHRILKIQNREGLLWYLMKGDANLEVDGWIPDYRVIGRVTHINGEPTPKWLGLLLATFFRFFSVGKEDEP